MKSYLMLFMVFFSIFITNYSISQSLIETTKNNGIITIKNKEQGLQSGNVALDCDNTGVYNEKYIIPSVSNGLSIIGNDISLCLCNLLPSSSVAFQKKVVLSLFQLKDNTISRNYIDELNKCVNITGSKLSQQGIHPLSNKKIYFVPDGLGNYIKNPQSLLLYKSGKIMELNVSGMESYQLQIPDGRIIAASHAMFHDNGFVSFVGVPQDGMHNISIEYSGKKLLAYFLWWDKNGELSGLDFTNDVISMSLPDNSLVSNVYSFSFLTLTKIPNVLERNATIKSIKFKSGNRSMIKIPNGQVLTGDISEINYYDNGCIQVIRIFPESKPIIWRLDKSQPVARKFQWEKKVYYETVDHLVENTEVYPAGTEFQIKGGIQLTQNGELIAYWNEN